MNTLYVATQGLETAPLADGAVLFNPRTNKFVLLNRSAERLWSELSRPATEDELVRGLCHAYPEIEGPAARQAVGQTLESLRQLDLVTGRPGEADEPPAPVDRSEGGRDQGADYALPSVRELDEDDLLKVFQMTAAEISVASCWWGNCPSASCP